MWLILLAGLPLRFFQQLLLDGLHDGNLLPRVFGRAHLEAVAAKLGSYDLYLLNRGHSPYLLLGEQLQNVLMIFCEELCANWVTMQYVSKADPCLIDAGKFLITDMDRNGTGHLHLCCEHPNTGHGYHTLCEVLTTFSFTASRAH